MSHQHQNLINSFNAITLSLDEVKICLDFGKKFTSKSANKSDLDFGHSKLPRGVTDAIADATTGKIGELAFKKICAKVGFNIGLDFDTQLGRHNIDYGQDVSSIEVNGKPLTPLISIDIKTSKSNSHWLLLETHKHWAAVIVLIVADIPQDAEKNLSAFEREVECKFEGFAYLSDFYDADGQPWFKYTNDMQLLNPKLVDKMYKDAIVINEQTFLKEQLISSFKTLKSNFVAAGGKINIGPKLKCPEQVGLPRDFLKSSENELVNLLNLIAKVSVPKEHATQEVIKSIIHINTHLSTLSKELKKIKD